MQGVGYLGGYAKFHLIRRKQFPLEIVFATFPSQGKALAIAR